MAIDYAYWCAKTFMTHPWTTTHSTFVTGALPNGQGYFKSDSAAYAELASMLILHCTRSQLPDSTDFHNLRISFQAQILLKTAQAFIRTGGRNLKTADRLGVTSTCEKSRLRIEALSHRAERKAAPSEDPIEIVQAWKGGRTGLERCV